MSQFTSLWHRHGRHVIRKWNGSFYWLDSKVSYPTECVSSVIPFCSHWLTGIVFPKSFSALGTPCTLCYGSSMLQFCTLPRPLGASSPFRYSEGAMVFPYSSIFLRFVLLSNHGVILDVLFSCIPLIAFNINDGLIFHVVNYVYGPISLYHHMALQPNSGPRFPFGVS
jgi:hypothetical protein